MNTNYTNYTRLEAQWIIYFDVLDIDVQYKPQTFMLSSGIQVTPTFYLPKYNCYAQISGGFAEDFAGPSSLLDLSKEKSITIIPLDKQPGYAYFTVIHPSGDSSRKFSVVNVMPDADNENRLLTGRGLISKEEYAEEGYKKAIKAIEASKKGKLEI